MTLRLAQSILLSVVLLTTAGASALEPERPGQESFLSRAAFADGRLWLLSDSGDLSSIAEGSHERLPEALEDPVYDLCTRDDEVIAIVGKRDHAKEWRLLRRDGGAWSVAATVRTEGDGMQSMQCRSDRITLLTTRRLIDIADGEQRVTPLSGTLGPGMVGAVYDAADRLYVGLNAGEWGGGLYSIDHGTGKIAAIERNASGELCGGPLNPDCDPVNGIAPEPWNPGCIAVAIGLVHFRPTGRIVEVCGDRVERLYFKPYGEPIAVDQDERDEPFSTVAFFGLTRTGNELWAAGIDGLYRITAAGTSYVGPLPNFEEIGDVAVSFAMPDMIIVLTQINQRLSVSGSAPMLVPR
jgi:hypothetical protein